jgi:branched-chain amino acid transport system substrate-binding protein
MLNKSLLGFGALAAALAVAPAGAQQPPIKIGLIMPYSGQFADTATQMDNAIKLYVKQHGDTVAGRKIEFVRKDTGGIAPDVAKRLAQELVVRDKVDILAGFVLTPNAMAAGDVSAEAKKFMVVMNAATAIITTKSPYMARTSTTVPQMTETMGTWAVKKGGIKKAYTMVSDYGPGHDAESGFVRGFKEAGGEIVGSVRFPVANPDFSAFVQRAKDLNPEAIFIFVPRKSMGDASLGIITVYHYDHGHDSALNKTFVAAFKEAYAGRNPNIYSIGGYDGIHLIYEALKKTNGNTDGDTLINAAKGMKWESPRGPISIDPETRDIVQTVYIRRVDKVGGETRNVEFDKIENVKDPVKARMKTN